MTEKIALGMIVKGTGEEPQNLDRALSSVAPHVDGIFITLTGPRKELKEAQAVCKKHGATVSYFESTWKATAESVDFLEGFFGYPPHMQVKDQIFVFDEARNFNFAQIDKKDYPWIIWMDCDDVLLRGENLHKLVEHAHENHVEAYYFNYLYQVELEGNKVKNILIQHLRERLIKNNGAFKWIAPIHETLIEQRPAQKTDTDLCEVLHLSTDADKRRSLTRNLKALELAIYQTKGEDPRHIYYLAKAFFDLNTQDYNEKSLKLMLNHYVGGDHQSGWPEERAQSWEYISELFRRKNEPDNAVKSGLNALIEEPENPALFINIALSYCVKQEWERALFWVKIATSIPQKKTTLVSNPKDIQARTLEIIFNCCLNLNKVDEAWAAIVKLKDLFSGEDSVEKNYLFMQRLRTQRDLVMQFVQLADYLKRSGEPAKIQALLASAPQLVKETPFYEKMYQENNPPTAWGKKSVVIFCGTGYTPWSPKKIENPGECFVGGSEEAVIYMSEALQKQGWEVIVYGDPSTDEGEINGVQWLPYYKFNQLDHFNILISWRQLGFFDNKLDAKMKCLWLHDIVNPLEYTKERVEQIDKVFFLSQWHRELLPELPENKAFLTTNGVNL